MLKIISTLKLLQHKLGYDNSEINNAEISC